MVTTRVGILGCGSIGTVLARYISREKDFTLCCLHDTTSKRARSLAKKLKEKPKIAKSADDMTDCDLIIEAASRGAVEDHALTMLDRCDLMIMSVSAFADPDLFSRIKKKAEENGRKVYMPSGAIAGLDAVRSANVGEINKVTITSRKPPGGLEGAPWIKKNGISLRSIKKPTVVFEGNAKNAARWFPKNINVAVTLSLAGIGVERTMVRIIADPFSDKNVHEISVEGEFGTLETKTTNMPSPKNLKTSRLAALSAIATLKKIKENMLVGT